MTGAISNVGEISCFCAQGCGALLLDEALSWAANNTNYHYVVLNSTEGAANWYRSHVRSPPASCMLSLLII